MGQICEAFLEGVCNSLRQAGTVPRRYFAALIALITWMYSVTKIVDRKDKP